MSSLPETVRKQVRERAESRCEYCRKPDVYSPHPPHVDHIISRKHRGSDKLDNLAWSCFQCNTCKGSDIGSLDHETGSLTPLFNPRTQNWHDHFEMQGGEIIGKTPSGRVTIHILQMNHPEQVELRKTLIDNNLW